MKSHHSRFEEAFRKLQQEVAHKTNKGLMNKDRNIKLLTAEVTEKKPTPPQNASSIKARKFKSIANRKNREAKVNEPDYIRFEPLNPRLFKQMMRAAEGGPNAPKPKEVGPVVPWDEPCVGVDFTVLEKSLADETVVLHKLVEPIRTKFTSDIDDKLPLDFFDCFNEIPEDEKKAMNGEKNINGFTKVKDKGKEAWHECKIIKYKPDSHTYTVQINDMPSIFDPSRPLIKEVSRFNIKFQNEDPSGFDKRLKLAEKLRQDFESEIRTDEFLDSIPDDDDYTSFIRPEFKKTLTEDALNVIVRVQKMFDVRGDLQINDETILPDIIQKVGVDINRYSPKKIKYPFTFETSYAKNLDKLRTLPFIMNEDPYFKATNAIWRLVLDEKEAIMNHAKEFFASKNMPIKKWYSLINDYGKWLEETFYDFTDNISNTILKRLQKVIDKKDGIDIIDVGGVRPYCQFLSPKTSVFNRFIKRVSLTLYEFALDIIDFNAKFFTNMLTFDWKELNVVHVSDEDFTTISQSVSDDTIRISRSPFVIELGDDQEDFVELLKNAFQTIPSNLVTVINPIATLFEQADSRRFVLSDVTAFSIFMQTNKKDDFIPTKLIFSTNDIKEYIKTKEESVICLINDHSQHVFNAFPLMREETNRVFEFFEEQPVPSLQETLNYIKKLIRQKNFFFVNFPYFINLGVFELNFESFRNSIFDCVEKHKNMILGIVADDLSNSINELILKYEKLFKQLKVNTPNPNQWSQKDAIMHQIPKINEEFQQKTNYINFLYDILYNLSYDLPEESIKNELNIKWWPVLIDMELGKSIGLMNEAGQNFKDQMPTLMQQASEELDKTKENIKKERGYNEKRQMKDYITHLEQKLVMLNEIENKLKNFSYDDIKTPRVNLWYIVSVSQREIERWSKKPICELNNTLVKESIDEWNNVLRKLTKEFVNDKSCLKILISTKNDIQMVTPLFKMVAQILSDKIKPHHRGNLEAIIGRKDFEKMTILEMREMNILEKLPAITDLYNTSKSEDKTDVELINVRSSVKNMKLIIEDNVIMNLDVITRDLLEHKSTIKNILSEENLAKAKHDSACMLQLNITKMLSVTNTLTGIQEITTLLSPLHHTIVEDEIREKMKSGMKNLDSLLMRYSKLLSQIGNDNLLLPFSTNSSLVDEMRNLMNELQQLRIQLMEVIVSFRSISPRLILVPDTRIIDAFSDNIDTKLSVLSLVFPGIEELLCSDDEIVGAMFESGDTIEFEEHVSLKNTVFTQIPQLENTICKTLKNMFFKAVNNEIGIAALPLQLQILMVLYNNEVELEGEISKSHKKILSLLKMTYKTSKNVLKAKCEKESVFIYAGEYAVEYHFQVTSIDQLFISPFIHETLFNLLAAYAQNKSILVHSQLYSVSIFVVKLFAYICGCSFFLIHSTESILIERISSILELLDGISTIVCLDETQLLRLKQMFDIATTIKTNLICTATANTVPPLMKTGKFVVGVDYQAFMSHISYIGNALFELQHDDIEFVTTTIAKYVHPYLLQSYFANYIDTYSSMLRFDFLENFRMVIPEDVLALKNVSMTNDSMKTPNRNMNVGRTLLNTKEFMGAFSKITDLFKSKTHVFLIAGPEFSGKSTVVLSAALSLGLPYYNLAFTNENWIKTVSETMIRLNDKPCVYHLLVPFAGPFLSHATSVFENSLICEGEKSLMSVGSNSYIIFELMNPLIMSQQVSIPIISYTKPLVQFSDLMNFWIINSKIAFDEESLSLLKEKVTLLVSSCFQLYQFFQSFVPLCIEFPDLDIYSLKLILIYSIFWSNSYAMKTEEDYSSYSKIIEDAIDVSLFKGSINEYYFNSDKKKFDLHEVKASNFLAVNNESLLGNYVSTHCGPIMFTNIPITQFINPVNQASAAILHNQSCLIVGGRGTGKTTIVQYLVDAHFTSQSVTNIRFNGNDTTDDVFFKAILAVSSLSSDGVLIPKAKSLCVIMFDPLPPVNSTLHGIILTAVKSNLVIVGNQIYKLKNFVFLMTAEEMEHQLSSSCLVIRIPLFTREDLTLLGQEMITRILMYKGMNSIKIMKILQSINVVFGETIKITMEGNPEKTGFLHFFCKAMRSIRCIKFDTTDDLNIFLKFKLNEIYQDYKFEIPNDKVMTLVEESDALSKRTEFLYTFDKSSNFVEMLKSKSKLFPTQISFEKSSLDFLLFFINSMTCDNSHSLIMDDATIDYEALVRFACFFTDSRFVTYQNAEQVSQLITDSVCSNDTIVLFFRKPDIDVLKLVFEKLKYTMLPLLYDSFKDKSFLELANTSKYAICGFPFANMISKERAVKETSQEAPTLKGEMLKVLTKLTTSNLLTSITVGDTNYRYMSMHMFRNIHFVSCIPAKNEIKEEQMFAFNVWNKANDSIDSNYLPLKRLVGLMQTLNDKFFVNTKNQVQKVVKKFVFLKNSVDAYVQSRKQFMAQVLSVMKSIEIAVADNQKMVSSIKEQMNLDEGFLKSHDEAIKFRSEYIAGLEREYEKIMNDLKDIYVRDEQYNRYKENDSANTIEQYKIATKNAAKAFSQDEQYKLYIQQTPDNKTRALFNGFCILSELTPRNGNDYWPEARGYLRVGRFGKMLNVFDPNTIRKDVALQLDIVMRDPLVSEDNFPKDSALRSLAVWLKAVHTHTKSTHFEKTVNVQMIEHNKLKIRKEAERDKMTERISAANDDLSKHKKSRDELIAKINEEKNLLQKHQEFVDKANNVSKAFPVIREDLDKFMNGEKAYGKNEMGFVLSSTCDIAVIPLLPYQQRSLFKKKVANLINDSFIDTTYFVSMKGIISTDDPLAVALLAGDRLIACFDPLETEYDTVGGNGGKPIPALSAKFTFTYTSPSERDFDSKIVEAAINGFVLIINHADSVLDHPFLCTPNSESITTAAFKGKDYSIDKRFRVVFFLDVPPTNLSSHVTFIHSTDIPIEKIESILISDDSPRASYEKVLKIEQIVHSQKESVYRSIQKIQDQLDRVHSSDATVLEDVHLQSILMMNSLKKMTDTRNVYEHMLDSNQKIIQTATKIKNFVVQLQNMHSLSPLYIFSFCRIKNIIAERPKDTDAYEYLLSVVANSLCTHHKWMISELKNVQVTPFANEKINVLHFSDVSTAADFIMKVEEKNIVYYSIEESSEFGSNKEKIAEDLDKGRIPVFTFFSENSSYDKELAAFLVSECPTTKWHKDSHIYIMVDSSYTLSSSIINNACLRFIDE